MEKQTSPNFFCSRGKIYKKELANDFSLSRNVVLLLIQSVLLVSAVKQQKELSLTPCWKWLQILDATFSNYFRYSTYSSLITRIYSGLYVVHTCTSTEPSTQWICEICVVGYSENCSTQ